MLSADKERAELLARAETEMDPEAISDIHMRLADITPIRAKRARDQSCLAGFLKEEQLRPASSFGWMAHARGACLCAVFLARHPVALTNRTNYLFDLEGTLWLENFVARYPGTVL
ncbi:MAG: hypothetical protein R3D29_12720 [Nitratireductor sp.]